VELLCVPICNARCNRGNFTRPYDDALVVYYDVCHARCMEQMRHGILIAVYSEDVRLLLCSPCKASFTPAKQAQVAVTRTVAVKPYAANTRSSVGRTIQILQICIVGVYHGM
jgi:hypothetical protein